MPLIVSVNYCNYSGTQYATDEVCNHHRENLNSHQHMFHLQSFVDPGREGVASRSSWNGGAT
jgi:hypothetical protein